MRDEDPEIKLPSMRATEEDRVVFQALEEQREPPLVRAVREPEPRRQRNGALWALCLSLLFALLGLGYWSHQQQSQLQRQLVATQDSFARISEEAAGRLQAITGKVSATESTLDVAEREQRAQLQKLIQQLDQLHTTSQSQAQQLDGLRTREQSARQAMAQQQAQLELLNEALEELPVQLQQLTTAAAQSAAELQAVQLQITQIKEQLQSLTPLGQQLAEQAEQLAGLQQKLAQQHKVLAGLSQTSASNTEQELLVLRSELEHSTAAIHQSLESIDRFRLQTNRSVNALSEQLSTMQRQLRQAGE